MEQHIKNKNDLARMKLLADNGKQYMTIKEISEIVGMEGHTFILFFNRMARKKILITDRQRKGDKEYIFYTINPSILCKEVN